MMQIAKGQSIDMGAVAKGFIGQRLSDILKHEGMTRGVSDLGGNIVAVGGSRMAAPGASASSIPRSPAAVISPWPR